MSRLVETRKLKRWLVLTRPYIITLANTTFDLDYGNIGNKTVLINTALNVGDNTIKFDPGSVLPYPTATYTVPVYVPTLNPGDLITINMGKADQETVLVESMTGDTATLVYPCSKAHAQGQNQICGGIHLLLTAAASSGDDSIQVNNTLGVKKNDVICISYKKAGVSEIATVDSVSGNIIKLNRMLYFDHTSNDQVESVPSSANVSSGSTRSIFDTLSSGTTKLSSPTKIPWIQQSEILSFDEARELVKNLSYIIGLENVRICRVVDLDSEILPLS